MPSLRLESVRNLRDLGGYPAAGGRVLRRGALYRSAELVNASQADRAHLWNALSIATLIDLRTDEERSRFGNVETATQELIEMPLVDDGSLGSIRRFSSLDEVYVDWLGNAQVRQRLLHVLSVVSESKNLPALLFCSAGKDRTGFVCSAVLGALGVSDEMIVRDYAMTAAHLDAIYTAWAQHPRSDITKRLEREPHLLGAPRTAMAALLRSIDRDYGSMRGFLEACGAGQALFDALERALLEES